MGLMRNKSRQSHYLYLNIKKHIILCYHFQFKLNIQKYQLICLSQLIASVFASLVLTSGSIGSFS